MRPLIVGALISFLPVLIGIGWRATEIDMNSVTAFFYSLVLIFHNMTTDFAYGTFSLCIIHLLNTVFCNVRLESKDFFLTGRTLACNVCVVLFGALAFFSYLRVVYGKLNAEQSFNIFPVVFLFGVACTVFCFIATITYSNDELRAARRSFTDLKRTDLQKEA